jgi:uncharacterized membrane protein YdjX (TVP38/TMEM64 family)
VNVDHTVTNTAPLRRLLPLGILALGLATFYAAGLDHYIDFAVLRDNRAALMDWVARSQTLAALVFVLLYVAVVAFSLPVGAALTVAGGFLFGTAPAAVYVVFGTTMGATILFVAARTAFADIQRRKATGPLFHKMRVGFQDDAFSYLVILRLIPLFPFWLVNLVPALLGIRLRTYVLGTFLGIIPGCVVFAQVGAGLGAVFDRGEAPELDILFEPEILSAIIALSLLALLPVAYKRYKARKERRPGAR